jgi:hypothetical protein
MNRLSALALVVAALAVPAGAVTVEAANGDWSKLPQLSQRGYQHLDEKMQAKLYEIAASRQCPSFGLKQDRLEFSVSFATQYSSDGTLQRLVLPQLDCAEAEGVVGGALLAMLQAGDYAPTGKSSAGWYQGKLNFSFAGDSARDASASSASGARVAESRDPNEVVCEKAEEIGTRLSNKRVCMTRSQWEEQKRQTRQMIEQVQMQRPCADTGGGISC